MKTLVTGGAGFIGSHLVNALISSGNEVTVVDDLSASSTKHLDPKAKFSETDILDVAGLNQSFQESLPDVVFHLAAHASVSESVKYPEYDANINVLGTIYVLEQCKLFGVSRIVFSSTGGALYGEPTYLPADEDHPIHPLSPYGASKFAAEIFIESICELNSISYTILRYGNVYGPRQSPYGEAGVVAIFANALINGESPVIYGDGKHQRDYVYVEDVVNANLLAMESPGNGKFNIGTNLSTSVRQIFDLIASEINSDLPPRYDDERAGDVRKIYLNCDKAFQELNWNPQVAIHNGIKSTVEWMRTQQR